MKYLLLVIIVGMIGVTDVQAADWLVINGISQHTNTTRQYNERNWGLGVQTNYYGTQVSAGWYRNSIKRRTDYLLIDAYKIPINKEFGFVAKSGFMTGYAKDAKFVVLPVLYYESKNVGWELLTLPSVGGKTGVYGLQMKLRW